MSDDEQEQEQIVELVLPERSTPLLILDVDGTVREGADDDLGRFVNKPEDVRVFPTALEQMRRWRAGGGRILGVSNQGGIALGIVDKADVIAAFRETLAQADHLFDKLIFCQHHPSADDLEQARCWCRKPAIGGVMEQMIRFHDKYRERYPPWMMLVVGDRPEDEQLARNLTCDFVWAKDWRAGNWTLPRAEA